MLKKEKTNKNAKVTLRIMSFFVRIMSFVVRIITFV